MLRLTAFAAVLVSISTVLLGGGPPPSGDGEGSPSRTELVRTEPAGVPAGFWWADFDGDGLDDAYAIGASGAGRLLRNMGDGSFEDVTLISGLDVVPLASLAVWYDFDGDGRQDLFIGTYAGASHLMRNAGDGTFQDLTAQSGLRVDGLALAAQVLDYDNDGLPDLVVCTATGDLLYHALGGGSFEPIDLGLARAPVVNVQPSVGGTSAPDGVNAPAPTGGAPGRDTSRGSTADVTSRRAAPLFGGQADSLPSAPPSPQSSTTSPPLCAFSIVDQSSLDGKCLLADSTPTLGRLYPLGIEFNIDSATGNVGIGTLTPGTKLDVAGTARMTGFELPTGAVAGNVLTSDASGVATWQRGHDLGGANVATGTNAMAALTTGTLNTANGFAALSADTTGFRNTASGAYALFSNTTGSRNTASGVQALYSNTIGFRNTASGYRALYSNTIGFRNTASGVQALYSNTSGFRNTASGYRALYSNTNGSQNTASGAQALQYNTTGSNNTASGYRALYSNTIGNDNTASGSGALSSNTTGFFNTASGWGALRSNTTGTDNTASGSSALSSNTTGSLNTASGRSALANNTTGVNNTATGFLALENNANGSGNTASGRSALANNTTGSNNIAIGNQAGASLTTGNDNIAIGNVGVAAEAATIRMGTAGTHTKTYLAGVRGVTTVNADAVTVMIDSAGQLGTVSSSRRFKEDIHDMANATERLLDLRPVLFRYKERNTDGSGPQEYGLIAEEVAEVFPDLVVYDEEGKPFTVKYHLLSSMLLNELQRQDDRLAELEELRAEVRELRSLESRLEALETVAVHPATMAQPSDSR